MSHQFFDHTDPLRIGVLGVGNIGMVHLQSALAMPNVVVSAAADTVDANRDRAEQAGVDRTYDDYVTLLETESLDAAIVALPPFLHADAVSHAADAGVDVFVEKPLARSTEEADELLAAADRADIAVGVDHTLRYQSDMCGVKAAYDAGRIGYVPYASMTRLNDHPLGRPPADGEPPAWPHDPDAAGGGSLFELGIHCFDLLEWLFGPIEVQDATLGHSLDIPVEDAATVLLRASETETAITLHCGSYQWEELPEVNTRVKLEGISGGISNDEFLPANFYASAARSAIENVTKRLTGDRPDVYAPTFYLEAHYDALADFCQAIATGDAPPIDGSDGRRAIELAETAYARATADERDRELSEALP